MHQVSPNLWVLTAGRADVRSDERARVRTDEAAARRRDATQFDWVIVDTPPVALLPDANLLAAMIDTALLVVSAQRDAVSAGAARRRGDRRASAFSASCSIAPNGRAAGGYGYYGYYDYDQAARAADAAVVAGGSQTPAGRVRMFSRTWRSIVLVVGETALLVAAVVLGSVRAPRRRTPGTLLADDDGILARAADRRRLPGVPALRRPLRSAHASPDRAICSSGCSRRSARRR